MQPSVARRLRRAAVTVTALALLIVPASVALASPNPDITDNESKCQIGSSLAVGKFITKKEKCVDSCYKKAFGSSGSTAECVPPYSGNTAGCVQSAEGKYQGLIQSKCNKDCPECYSGGDCQTDADVKIATAEAHLDTLGSDVFCDDSGSADGLTLSEFKCQRTVGKFLALFTAKKMKCLAKCRKAEQKDKVAFGSCDPPVSDQKTQECISREEDRAAFRIDKKCESSVNPSADKPECGSFATNDGAAWVAGEEGEVDTRDGDFYCLQ